jgi:PPOX class probable F420-dependent enzyme
MNINHTTKEFIERARVARLATVNSQSEPHLVPVVFVFDGNYFYIPIDEKRKTVKPDKLKRVLNIKENPQVALLIDEYSEDWTRLAFVMVQGKASIVNQVREDTRLYDAYKKLVAKYLQYQKVRLSETCIMIKPEKILSWQNSHS